MISSISSFLKAFSKFDHASIISAFFLDNNTFPSPSFISNTQTESISSLLIMSLRFTSSLSTTSFLGNIPSDMYAIFNTASLSETEITFPFNSSPL